MNKWLNQIKVKAILPAAALIAAAAIGTTFAWQTWDLSVENQLKAHSTKVTVDENFDPDPSEGTDPVKQVRFVNSGTSDVFLRVSYTDYWEMDDETGKNFVLSGVNADNKRYALPQLKLKADDDNSDDPLWELKEDGWYYYKRVLKKGETTDWFIDGVTFAKLQSDLTESDPKKPGTDLAPWRPDDYLTKYYHLFVKVEAVQCSSDGPGTLNKEEVDRDATTQVFGMAAKVDTNTGIVTWKPVEP